MACLFIFPNTEMACIFVGYFLRKYPVFQLENMEMLGTVELGDEEMETIFKLSVRK